MFVRLLEVTISVGGDTLFSKVKKNCTIILFYIILHLIYSLFLLLWYLYYWVINNYAMAGWGASLCLCESLANAKRNTL